MDRKELASRIDAVSRLHGEFVLRSGIASDQYFDKYRFESDPTLLTAVAEGLAALVPADTQRLAGLELGGIPIAIALSLHTGLPLVFVRKQVKTYGTCRLAEGGEISGQRLLIVEDIVTSGGQVVTSCEALRQLGAIVEHVVCVIDREAGGAEALAKAGLQLRALFTKSDLDGAPQTVDKAFAYITNGSDLLVFEHVGIPEAGIQVPAGTIHEGETSASAVVREAREETGLDSFRLPMFLGTSEFDARPYGKDEIHRRHFFHLPFTGTAPKMWRHYERHASDDPGRSIEFELYWLPLTKASLSLSHEHGALLPVLSRVAAETASDG